jgi:hypothetical protein
VAALALVAFSRWSASGPWAFPLFLAALALMVYLPGRALLGPPGARPLDELALALGLGTAAATAAFRAAASLGRPRLALLIVPLAAAVLAARRWRPWSVSPARWPHAVLPVAIALACLPLALVPMYYRNLDRLPSGDLTWVPMPDAVLHLAIARGLTASFPPEVPFLPGRALHYHYGMDALPALFAATAGLDVGDLTVRLVPTFLVALLTLAAFCLGRAWVGSAAAGLATAVLTVLGEDLAWVPGLLTGASEVWAIHFLGAPTISSLYGLNPLLPGLAFLLLGLLAMTRHGAEGGRAWALRAAVLLAVVADYKVFAAAQLLAALGLCALLHLLRLRDRRPLAVWALAAPCALLLAAPGASATRALVRLDPWPYVPAALIRSGLWDTWLGRQTDALWAGGAVTPSTLLAFFGLLLPLYLLAVYGARAVGLPAVLRALRPRAGGAARLTAAAFVLCGPVLALLLAITPATYEPRARYNEAIWFLVQSKLLAWPFAVEQVFRLAAGRARVLAAGLALMLALSLPSTVQYLHQQATVRQIRLLGPEETDVLRFLDGRVPARCVALARPEIAAAVLALTRCRAPVFTVHPFYFVTSDELQAHARRSSEFWDAWRAGTLRLDLARAYGATLVVADTAVDGRAPPAAGLRPLYENARYAVYALPGAAP